MHNASRYNPSLLSVLKEAVRGKSVSRTMTNLFWRGRIPLSGTLLDIGGAGRGSHYRFLNLDPKVTLTVADMVPQSGTDFVLDITKEKVPLPDSSQDTVLMFNILEHLPEHSRALSEVRRLLRPGGQLIGSIPFLVNVHPDPHDYLRLTREGLERLFSENGFSVLALEPVGRGPFLAGYEQLDMVLNPFVHLICLPIVWCLDGLLLALKPKRDFRSQFPLAYNFVVRKKV